MEYIDGRRGRPRDTLGHQLEEQLQDNISEIRVQSGFFSAGALGLFVPVFQRLAAGQGTIHMVLGSNDGATAAGDIEELAGLIQVNRPESRLGVVRYSGAFFHPKVYHLRRADGTQWAYVGSANLTPPGLNGVHVEAGLLLDSRQDGEQALDEIAQAIDDWFVQPPAPGLHLVCSRQDISALLRQGILSAAPHPAVNGYAAGRADGGGPAVFPTRGAAFNLPRLPRARRVAAPGAGPQGWQARYPIDVIFDDVAAQTPVATAGANALTGATLPDGAVGLVVEVSGDTARAWRLQRGTANFSVPILTMPTLQFGRAMERTVLRPRLGMNLAVRYLSDQQEFRAHERDTNVSVYGFEPNDTTHRDRRLVVRRRSVTEIHQQLLPNNLPLPEAGNVALVEWPTRHNATFRITFLHPQSQAAVAARALLDQARQMQRPVCLLPAGFTPAW